MVPRLDRFLAFYGNGRFIHMSIAAGHPSMSWARRILPTLYRHTSFKISFVSHQHVDLSSVFFFPTGVPIKTMNVSIPHACYMPQSCRPFHVITSRQRFFLVSLCPKANAEMVPKIPSCHYMLLMLPSRLKFSSNQFHVLFTCKITAATGWQPNCSK